VSHTLDNRIPATAAATHAMSRRHESVGEKQVLNFVTSIRRSVDPSIRRSVGPSVRRSVGPSVRRSVGPSVRRSDGGTSVRRPSSVIPESRPLPPPQPPTQWPLVFVQYKVPVVPRSFPLHPSILSRKAHKTPNVDSLLILHRCRRHLSQ
jgi:hypothetical protein